MENDTVVAMSPKAEVAATLVIQDFAVAMAKKPRLCIESDVFRVRGAPMRLEVYPSGRTEQRRGFVSAYLVNRSRVDTRAKFKLVTDVRTQDIGEAADW